MQVIIANSRNIRQLLILSLCPKSSQGQTDSYKFRHDRIGIETVIFDSLLSVAV
jgi:hypothetical protein